MSLLLGLPGQVTTLLARLTSGRATNLDNLDATVSSRAPSSTAVSNADYTAARAAGLDYAAKAFAKPTATTHLPLLPNTQPSELLAGVSRIRTVDQRVDNVPSAFSSFSAGFSNVLRIGAGGLSTSYQNIINITSGSGVLDFLFAECAQAPTGGTAMDSVDIKVTLDGNLIIDTSTDTNGRATQQSGVVLVGKFKWGARFNPAASSPGTIYHCDYEPGAGLPFNSSLKIEAKLVTNAQAYKAEGLAFAYRRTS